MRFRHRCYRGHDPRWSFTPLSGDGAARTGGRFNRRGEPTLYLALDVVTAVGECTQGFTQRLQPLLICEYDVDIEPVADLRTMAGCRRHRVDPADLACSWLSCLRAGRQAPSWRVVDRLRDAGHVGALVPAYYPGAGAGNANLVLWRWGPELPTQVRAYDPSGRLPTNQLSWEY